jgi:H+/Cl- antiporter ClcA
MEQVMLNQSRIPPRITFLKPLSAAIAIGTGGPFGAEGPIIATGGALGSLVGQLLKTTAVERKTLLAAGAAAGMAATFGSPVSAVLLAIELLLFELKPRSLIPVSLAAAAATAVRIAFSGTRPIFLMPDLVQPGPTALALYVITGALVGIASVAVTRIVYAVEDGFEKLPIHWMWWPALGGLVVGIIGYFVPRTLGVGYTNIEQIVSADLGLATIAILCTAKFVSWAISLGSGTSGGTLAPLFTIGGGIGALLGAAWAAMLPNAGMDLRIAALVGMAAMFAGASRAVLASAVFAFETTRQPIGLLPLLGGCTAAYLISCLYMRNSIMTEKIARRGVRIAGGYTADFLDLVLVKDRARAPVATVDGSRLLSDVKAWLASSAKEADHQGFPVVDDRGFLVGVVTRRDILGAEDGGASVQSLIRRKPVVVFDDSSLREAVEHMVRAGVGRLPVVKREDPRRIVGILTRSDILEAHRRRMEDTDVFERSLEFPQKRAV